MSPPPGPLPKQIKRNSKRTNPQMNSSQNQKRTPNTNVCYCIIRHQRKNEPYHNPSALDEMDGGGGAGGREEIPMRFLEKLRDVSEDPASARYESTTKEMETVEPRVQPKPMTPKNTVGAIHGSSTWADQPNPQSPTQVNPCLLVGGGGERGLPMTVEMATGMTIMRRNSGSKIPPLRRVIQRQTMSETLPARDEPRIPPMKGAR